MKKGFTIIETTLVLAISALFAVMMMAGWSANIGRQRYNDALNTFKADIQDVFADVENPSREATRLACGKDRNDIYTLVEDVASGSSGSSRGASNCIILGKMITFSTVDSGKYEVTTIIGQDNPRARLEPTVSRALYSSNAGFVHSSHNLVETKKLNWDTKVSLSSKGSSLDISKGIKSVIVVRSPIDGTIIAYKSRHTSNEFSPSSVTPGDIPEALQSVFIEENQLNATNKKVNVCLKGEPSVFGGWAQNRILAIGSTASSVEILPLNAEGGDNTC